MKRVSVSLFCLTLIYLLFTVPACSHNKNHIYRKSRVLMNTIVTITVVTDTENAADKAIEHAFLKIEDIENKVNFYSPASEIALINKSAGIAEVKVSSDTITLLDDALFVSEKTQGAFDVTIGPVMRLYNFFTRQKPEDLTLNNTLPLVNYRDILINKNISTVFLKKRGMLIDPGGIAKGYAADRVTETLRQQGIVSGIVAIAGDIRAFGMKPDGKPWKVGIRNPRAKGPEDDIIATIEITDAAISTSGDYERFFIDNGKRYHHILSPKTGRPAELCRSVTVIAPEGYLADSFSTGIFVLGPEKGLKLLKTLGYHGVIVDNEGEIHMTPDLRGKIEFQRNS